MQELNATDKLMSGVLGKRTVKGEIFYRLSQYVGFYETETECLIKSTLTGKLIMLEGEEKEAFLSLKTKGMTGLQILRSGLGKLVECYMAVPEEYDDLKTFTSVFNILNSLQKNKEGIVGYTILPTLGCNARCSYCYEEGVEKRAMSMEKADDVVQFILRTRAKEPLNITWYGGEPLTASGIISHICEELTKENVPFTSIMITNGVLMTRELAHVIKTDWHVKKVQISADGAREDYEERKQYKNPEIHNYDAMLRAIHYMLDEGLDVTIRCNYDRYNVDRIKSFLADLHTEFPNAEQLHIYFSVLFQERITSYNVQLYEKTFELLQLAGDEGLIDRTKNEAHHVKTHYCMADAPNAVVIDPNGNLFKCMNRFEEPSLGSIYDSVFQLAPCSEARIPAKECERCPYLPECSPYYRNLCPEYNLSCKCLKDIALKEELKRTIKDMKARWQSDAGKTLESS